LLGTGAVQIDACGHADGAHGAGNVHLYKRHWNTVVLDGTVADDEVREWIEHSYDLVVAKLPRHRRDALLPHHPGV
jgi:predicted DNA-binding protein (MmcQ/YjbR family)